jgi:hypothetical protein
MWAGAYRLPLRQSRCSRCAKLHTRASSLLLVSNRDGWRGCSVANPVVSDQLLSRRG